MPFLLEDLLNRHVSLSFHKANCRSEEHTSELQSRGHLVCRLLFEEKQASAKSATSPRARHSPPPASCAAFKTVRPGWTGRVPTPGHSALRAVRCRPSAKACSTGGS